MDVIPTAGQPPTIPQSDQDQYNVLVRQYQDLLNNYSDEVNRLSDDPIKEFPLPDQKPVLAGSVRPDAFPPPAKSISNVSATPVLLSPPTGSQPPVLIANSSQEKPKPDIFKYLFVISVILFIAVVLANVIVLYNSQSKIYSPVKDTPQEVPSSTQSQDTSCVLNDIKYSVNQQFVADDGCSLCRCLEDMSVVCDDRDCQEKPVDQLF
ncbi:MAG: hypothetical protein WC686_04005 [Candidatus Shapirobacteria bacterium]|jgi:hypothetical protein